MLEIKKIETGRMENGTLVITNTQWGVFQNDNATSMIHGHEWEKQPEMANGVRRLNGEIDALQTVLGFMIQNRK